MRMWVCVEWVGGGKGAREGRNHLHLQLLFLSSLFILNIHELESSISTHEIIFQSKPSWGSIVIDHSIFRRSPNEIKVALLFAHYWHHSFRMPVDEIPFVDITTWWRWWKWKWWRWALAWAWASPLTGMPGLPTIQCDLHATTKSIGRDDCSTHYWISSDDFSHATPDNHNCLEKISDS